MNKNFSIILNSRGRPKLLKNLINSIAETTDDLSKINMYCNLDNDDSESIEFSKENQPFECHFIIGQRPDSLNQSLTDLGLMADGSLVFNINDDCLFENETGKMSHWDTTVLNKVEEYKKVNNIRDEILYVAVGDNSCDKNPGAKYASFPIISREAIHVIQRFMFPEFVSLGGDSSIWRLYNEINRCIYIPELEIRHFYHETIFAVMSPDLVAYEGRIKNQQFYVDPFTFDINPYVKKLQNYIRENEK